MNKFNKTQIDLVRASLIVSKRVDVNKLPNEEETSKMLDIEMNKMGYIRTKDVNLKTSTKYIHIYQILNDNPEMVPEMYKNGIINDVIIWSINSKMVS